MAQSGTFEQNLTQSAHLRRQLAANGVQNIINGLHQDARSGKSFTNTTPIDNSELCQVAEGDQADGVLLGGEPGHRHLRHRDFDGDDTAVAAWNRPLPDSRDLVAASITQGRIVVTTAPNLDLYTGWTSDAVGITV